MMQHEDPLDRAIDEGARQMMAGEPSARFEATVMSRIETPHRRTVPWLGISAWRIATASAIAALVVVLVVTLLEGPDRRVSDRFGRSPETQAAVSEMTRGSEPTPLEPSVEGRASGLERFTGRTAGRSETNLETLTLPPIEEPPIVVESIALDPLELPGIEMARLELAPLALDPVTVANTQETP